MKCNLKPAAKIFNDAAIQMILPALPSEAVSPVLKSLAKQFGVSKRKLMKYWNRQYRLGNFSFPAN